jgi:malate synthase
VARQIFPLPLPDGVSITGPVQAGDEAILSGDALTFVAGLARKFGPRVTELLARRRERQTHFDAGRLPDFLPETAEVRAASWKVAPVPEPLLDRRVEITGPTDRKMVINALNSGARVFMADFEDANSPTWRNLVDGHVNLRDAVRRTITFVAPETGKR